LVLQKGPPGSIAANSAPNLLAGRSAVITPGGTVKTATVFAVT